MLGCFVEQRVSSLERALCLAASAKHSGGGETVKRCDGDLQGVALGSVGRLLEHGQRALEDPHALFRAEVGECGIGGFGVVANGGRRLAASLEMRGELGG